MVNLKIKKIAPTDALATLFVVASDIEPFLTSQTTFSRSFAKRNAANSEKDSYEDAAKRFGLNSRITEIYFFD